MAYPAAGIGGAVKNGANTVANLQKWTITPKGATAKTTPFQAPGSWEVNTPTIKSWAAEADGFTDPSDTNGQLALMNGLNTVIALELDIDGTHHWTGNAILVGFDPASDAQNMNTIKYHFTGTGALTFT
jgi:hypothetical protein